MALERLSLAVDGHRESSVDGGQGRNHPTVEGGDDGSRVPRLPRWTRQEILVLIQGKRVAENRVRRGRTAGMALGSGQIEPKWAAVSSYCKRHGVNRGPVQCRKRWSNLAGDFKKIKEWESKKISEEGESFWVMRNDLRREKKLPGFFDRDVYDILDGGVSEPIAQTDLVLALAPPPPDDAVFDSGRTAAPEDGLFSDFEQSAHEETVVGSPGTENQPHPPPPIVVPPPSSSSYPAPISEIEQPLPIHKVAPSQGEPQESEQQQQPHIGASSRDRGKRKRVDTDEGMDSDAEASLESRLMKVLERNGKMLSQQLENQNNNFMLEREQRKDLLDGLVGVLNKLADAFGRIADKL